MLAPRAHTVVTVVAALITMGVSELRSQPSRPGFPAVSIPNTEVRLLHSKVTGRDYDLYLYLPSRITPNYPADATRRGLMGASLGGLFTLYAMYAKPGLFAGYAAGSPAVTYANGGAFDDEAAYAANHTDLRARFYIAVGDQEPLYQPVQQMVSRIRQRNYRGLLLESRVVAEERHSGNKPEAFNRGLRFLFRNP